MHIPKLEKSRKEVVGAESARLITIVLSVFPTVPRVSQSLVYAIKCLMIFKRRMITRHRTLDPAGLYVDYDFI